MFKIKKYSRDFDLDSFYREAHKRGFTNNSSKKVLIDCFDREKEKQVWILYYQNIPVGSVAAHSFFDVMGENSYRIAVRTCVLTNLLTNHKYGKNLRTKNVIMHHQNPTAQFLIPACIDWVPDSGSTYITTNNLQAGTQSKVDKIFAPLMEQKGIMSKEKIVEYRGAEQTVWKFNKQKFLADLSLYPRWC